ncbi:MAG TPA: hemolysin III family protein [Pseudomonadales bacterium]
MRPRPGARLQSLGEEIANAVSHGAGALLSIAALPVLIVDAAKGGAAAAEIVGVTLFGMTMLVMYLASTLYHALPHPPTPADASSGAYPASPRRGAKRVFRLLDHAAIYLLIAGTYTPFALGAFREEWGWPMFGLVWGLASAGVVLKCLAGTRFPLLSTLLYLAMGWLVIGAAEPLFTRLPPAGLAWLAGGGAAYTLGVVFFALDERLRYAHFAWHLFVLAGTACHFVAVLGYA